jgi:putative tricarboxylic transport membrane protein
LNEESRRLRSTRLRERWSHYDEVAVAIVLLAVFVFLRVRIDTFTPGGRGRTFLTPDAWPGAILVLAIALSTIYLAQSLRRARRAPSLLPVTTPLSPTADEKATITSSGDDGTEGWRLLAGFGLLLAYIYFMPAIGFVPVTLLFCIAFLLMVGERRWWVVAAIPAVATVVVVAIFTRLLVVPLPRGQGVFLELSTYLY